MAFTTKTKHVRSLSITQVIDSDWTMSSLRSCSLKTANKTLGCCELKLSFRSPSEFNHLFHFNTLSTIVVVNNHMKHYVIERQFMGFLCSKKIMKFYVVKNEEVKNRIAYVQITMFTAFLCTQSSLRTTHLTFPNQEFKVASSKKVCNLAEAIDFVLDSDNESSDEQTDQECDPCYRVSINFLSILCCRHCHSQIKVMKLLMKLVLY